MEKKEQTKSFKMSKEDEKNTDLSLLDQMDKELGIKEVPAPKSIQVIFPKEK